MTRSKQKMTMRQVEDALNTIAERQNQIAHLLQNLLQEAEKQNTIMLNLLIDLDKIEVIICPSCEGVINFPTMKGLERDTHCPYCQKALDSNQQTLFGEEE